VRSVHRYNDTCILTYVKMQCQGSWMLTIISVANEKFAQLAGNFLFRFINGKRSITKAAICAASTV
ncbi:MAG TPA: hypothetical protein VED37_15080, partial [Ktedonobacteraceae bacterium]|nr:hypothetical protein [Ktedonobacteraceae bacterium]